MTACPINTDPARCNQYHIGPGLGACSQATCRSAVTPARQVVSADARHALFTCPVPWVLTAQLASELTAETVLLAGQVTEAAVSWRK